VTKIRIRLFAEIDQLQTYTRRLMEIIYFVWLPEGLYRETVATNGRRVDLCFYPYPKTAPHNIHNIMDFESRLCT